VHRVVKTTATAAATTTAATFTTVLISIFVLLANFCEVTLDYV